MFLLLQVLIDSLLIIVEFNLKDSIKFQSYI